MYFGIDEDGIRTPIEQAKPDKTYYCPCCKAELIQKRGVLVAHHFAHRTLENCVSYYDNKGPWHREMQSYFPEKNQEIFNDEFGRHFFDVLTDKNTIIEFQNSSIDYDSFWDRTNAYCAYAMDHNGQKPIWCFNYIDRHFYVVKKGNSERNRKISWSWPTKIFENYKCKEESYELWFHIAPHKYKQDETLITHKYGYGLEYIPDSRIRHGAAYIKVIAIYDNSSIYCDVYTKSEFIKYLRQK